MSIQEVADTINAFKRKKEYNEKIEAERLFVLAEAISTRVAFFLSSKEDRDESMVLMPWDAYPTIFSDEMKMYKDEQMLKELEQYKANRIKYAQSKNRKVEVK